MNQALISFATANLASILVILVMAIVFAFLYRTGHQAAVKKMILSLVVKAEKDLGSGTGTLKYALVIDAVYTKLPLLIQVLFTKSEIETFIEEAVTSLKSVLTTGTTLTGYDDEKYIATLIGSTPK